MPEFEFVDLEYQRLPEAEMLERARAFLLEMSRRRSVRSFSSESVSRELIELAIRTACTAPSGANRQPWTFVAVSDPGTKSKIRRAAEAEERRSYESRMPAEWLEAIAPLGTGWRKPYLETAPWLVVVFAESYSVDEDGARRKNYYVSESVGIACGLFVTALHRMGLVTLTHTPNPMGFLSRILKRPSNERPYILFPVGYPAESVQVPCLEKKPSQETICWMEGTPGEDPDTPCPAIS